MARRLYAVGATCMEAGCSLPIHARGYCHKHYVYFINSGDLKVISPRKQKAKCTVCGIDAMAKQLCEYHYNKLRRKRKLSSTTSQECNIENCHKPMHAKGLCDAHYRVQRNSNPVFKPCRYCNKRIKSRGLCDTHYRRWRLGQDLRKPIRQFATKLPTCITPGCNARTRTRNLCERHYKEFLKSRAVA